MNGGGGGGPDYSSGGTGPSETSKIHGNKTEINNYLNNQLRDKINQKDVDKINMRKETIRNILSDLGDVEDINVGGSYSRHTYVDGLSDVDLLVNLGKYSESDWENKDDSSKILIEFAKRIEKRYPETKTKVGKMAVTLNYSDGTELQVIPAFQYHSGFKVPDPDTGGWNCTFPKNFRDNLTEINQKNNSQIVPAIKLTKHILKKNDIKIKSYHLENMAIDAFKEYNGTKTPADLVSHLIKHSKQKVFEHVGDPCRQSDYIDNYLGNLNSKDRKDLSKRLGDLDKKISNAKDKDDWKNLVE